MRQLKYIEDENFFKELQALKDFTIKHYCSYYDIANLMNDSDIVDVDEIEDFLDSFELSSINSIVYTDDYIFVFDACTNSELFKLIVSSIKKGIRKMNDDNNPLKLKELQELNEQLMRQLDEYKRHSQKSSSFKSLEEVHIEHCVAQVSNSNRPSNISIDPLHLFNW